MLQFVKILKKSELGTKMQNFPTFSTARLVLSLPTISDLEDIVFHANSTSEIAENTITFPYPYEEKHAHFWLKMAEDGFAKKDAYIFAIREKENLKLIGAIGLHLDFANRKAEIGYWLGKSFWNKGYVSEALQKLWNLASKNYILIKFMLLIFRTILLREKFCRKTVSNLRGF